MFEISVDTVMSTNHGYNMKKVIAFVLAIEWLFSGSNRGGPNSQLVLWIMIDIFVCWCPFFLETVDSPRSVSLYQRQLGFDNMESVEKMSTIPSFDRHGAIASTGHLMSDLHIHIATSWRWDLRWHSLCFRVLPLDGAC